MGVTGVTSSRDSTSARATVASLTARLAAHEAVSGERWREIEAALSRLELELRRLNDRWWWVLVTVSGAGLAATASLVLARLP